MKNTISKKTSDVVDELKGISVISIVSAHVAVGNDDSIIMDISETALKAFGVIGVIVFLIISGYLFGFDNKTLKAFIKKKSKSLFIPWFIIGSVVYMISSLSGTQMDNISIKRYFLFLLGQQTYLYFMTILTICYSMNFYFKKNNKILLLWILLTAASIVITSYELISINPYLNPLNWVGYFAFGILLSNNYGNINGIFLKLINKSGYWSPIILVSISMYSLISMILRNQSPTYWSLYGLIFAFSLIALFFILLEKNKTIYSLVRLGRNTLSIYLLHMPVAGVVNSVFTYFDNYIIIKPFFVIALTILIIEVLKYLAKIVGLQKLAGLILGSR